MRQQLKDLQTPKQPAKPAPLPRAVTQSIVDIRQTLAETGVTIAEAMQKLRAIQMTVSRLE